MTQGKKGAHFTAADQALLLRYKLAVAPFVKLLPWLLMCVIAHPNDADENTKMRIAEIVTTLFCVVSDRASKKNGTECAFLSWFRKRFDIRTSDPFKKNS